MNKHTNNEENKDIAITQNLKYIPLKTFSS